MSTTLKLLIPAVLGMAAAGINWVMLSSRAGTVQFVAATREIEAGEYLSQEDVQPIELPLQFQSLVDTAIPYSEVGLLAGQVAQRSLSPGDLLFFRDTTIRGLPIDRRAGEELFFVDISDVAVVPRLMRIGYYVWFRVPEDPSIANSTTNWTGPFRIVSVDSVISNHGEVERRRPQTVTVAYKTGESPKQDQQIAALERFSDRQQLEGASLLSIRVEPTAH
ncbi:SAF domain-containing protein [Pirellulales bacterium]|nr:SAF domain-containing protein [Pirellulales bacterium]